MKSELSSDGIHPNEAGYRAMMTVLEAALLPPVRKQQDPAAAARLSASPLWRGDLEASAQRRFRD
jgi:hypothetical protein